MLKFGGVPCQPPGLGLPSSQMPMGDMFREPFSIISRVTAPEGTRMLFWLIVGMKPSPSRSNFSYQAERYPVTWTRGM